MDTDPSDSPYAINDAAQTERPEQPLRAAGAATPALRQRSYEQIDRANDLLAASLARLNRGQARRHRSDGAHQREQDATSREPEASGTWRAMQAPPLLDIMQGRANRLREQAAAAAHALARAEDTLAHEHERRHRAQQAADHREHAVQARTAAGALHAIGKPPRDVTGTAPLPG
ncbi:hypothetical protein GCM10010277_08430 [Streptomyces longisporoflavus]|uniref:hypothetical protein n=1 Tax=Streptomyces longisporoflavus TaxID=28044 RepID=UPI00167E683B|nr:hypothetical protein [Streptomyces longisporoflavus]GGV27077.1 hypothetical protein GCM10010277_08430 [Streptomyces longisporoflavus]